MGPSMMAFKRGETPQHIRDILAKLQEEETNFNRIRCPLCGWHPTPANRWTCVDTGHPEHFKGGCGQVWNTFTTRGKCPGCSYQWRWTACLDCHGWSLHEDWYESEDDESGPAR
jgi:hypothetical protein